jgi:CheY-like chemotaxis protein
MRQNAKILVAEDDSNDQLLLEKAFQAAGLNSGIRYAPDGADAIEYLKNLGPTELPALLLVDLKMPRMNGFELMDWVGRQRRLDSMRVVVLTSSDAPDDKNHAVGLGADEYYIKPQEFHELFRLAVKLNLYLETHAALARSAEEMADPNGSGAAH